MSTDGCDRKNIVTGCHLPDGIVVDAAAGHIYWTNMGIPNLNDGSVERGDAHRYRVGVNADQLSVNKPRCPVRTYHADGRLRLAGNPNPDAYYEPNSFGGPVQDGSVKEPPLKISGTADRYNHREGNDDYRQPGDLFRLMSAGQKEQLFDNIKAGMEGVPLEIVKRQIAHFYRADADYGPGSLPAWAFPSTA